jgi:hypothetical protein
MHGATLKKAEFWFCMIYDLFKEYIIQKLVEVIHLEVCENGLSLKLFLFLQGACNGGPLGPSV